MASLIYRLSKNRICTIITRSVSTGNVFFGAVNKTSPIAVQSLSTKVYGNSLVGCKQSYKNLFTCSSCLQQKASPSLDEFRLIYDGPLSRKIKTIKWVSLTTAAMSVGAAPLFILNGKESVPFIGKAILATTVVTMGVTTTLLLHWLTKVYVHRMFFHPQTRTFAAETFNFFGRTKTEIFSVEDIIIPEVENVFSTFEANGRKFFVHMDLKEAEQILKYVREYNMEQL